MRLEEVLTVVKWGPCVLSTSLVRPPRTALGEPVSLWSLWAAYVPFPPEVFLFLGWSYSLIVIRTWESTQMIWGYQRVCGVSLKSKDGSLLSTFWKGTMIDVEISIWLLESTWSFKVDFNIRMYIFVTAAQPNRNGPRLEEERVVCLFLFVWLILAPYF